MNLKRALLATFSAILFLGGISIDLFLSGNLLWGEMEARLYKHQSGDKGLAIECPLMVAAWETAEIKTVITNTLSDKDIRPQVIAYISGETNERVASQTLALAPLESQPLQWTVSKSDVIYGRLILVNILQRQYSDLTSRQGACSILIFSLPGLNGSQTLVFSVFAGILWSLFGAGLLIYMHSPFTDFTKQAAQMITVFLCLALAGLFSALGRFWGLTLVFDSAALLTLTVMLTETFLFSKK